MDEDEGEEPGEVDERYFRQIIDSQFFDIDRDVRVPRVIGVSQFYFGEKEEEEQPPPEMVLYEVEDVDATVEDEDVDAAADSSPSSLTLQTLVRRPFGSFLEAMMEIMIELCRIKPTTTANEEPFEHFMLDGVDVFYRECMPTFLSGPPEEAADDQRFYEVQDEDIRKNDWLRLYTHFALLKVCEAGSHPFLPKEMELKKILVETRVTTQEDDDDDDDDDEPPSPILKSMNAIFHISFRANCRDYRCIIRRTTDGLPGHMRLEVHTC
ncbi:PREDICTED: UPF0725 protein At3g44770-like [Camelina sativa]|uniref:UPF0725 protein At3g44770-like n=1 Tax=Camelina sativa TaxID=90675 RepID=A0ABM0SWU9_CAMSA|nr:PREDICTED: UPF0725 protein At3g44770-like [Camelina sativa]